jgi:hypothetical protein
MTLINFSQYRHQYREISMSDIEKIGDIDIGWGGPMATGRE